MVSFLDIRQGAISHPAVAYRSVDIPNQPFFRWTGPAADVGAVPPLPLNNTVGIINRIELDMIITESMMG